MQFSLFPEKVMNEDQYYGLNGFNSSRQKALQATGSLPMLS